MLNNYTKRMYPLWGLAPGFIVYFVFFLIPFITTFYYSFTSWDFYTAKFIGLSNYQDIVIDPLMKIALKNTLIFTFVTGIAKVALGMGLALFVNQKLKSSNFIRTVFFLPAVLNTIAVGILFTAILHPTNGLLNQTLGNLHLNVFQLNWLTDIKLAIFSIAGIETWKWAGYNMVIILSGLQSISKEYYESAEIDGASGSKRFWHITFPLIMPAFNVALVGNIIGGLRVFDLVAATTGGGPGRATEVLNTAIFENFGNNLQGLASAGNVVLTIFVAVTSIITYVFIRRREVEL
ncbi:carbohydrate ABC transporter permease [Paenibacillus sp. Soil750]|uniref:carbohydrate ABC transporter permease n=1 Tax=Paenibacillus sp. Soil750 TaxID=1736398 RepID=UPI000AD079EB|nr:sugar ABC transporter permease [Paenibacillus sp. Soil750]